MRMMINELLVGRRKGKRLLRRTNCRRGDNIKTDLKDVVC
jgi:hypothetical protein